MPAADHRIAVVGGGAMGGALVAGLISSGRFAAHQVVVAEPHEARRAELRDRHAVGVHADPAGAVSGASAVVLAVKPNLIVEVARTIARSLEPDAVVVSIAAGVTTATLAAALPTGTSIVRAMPNTPALVRDAVTAIAPSDGTPAAALDVAEEILDAVGSVVRVAEAQLDAVTGLSGSGPAYVFYLAEALTDAGVRAGLPRDVAAILASRTIHGSARMLVESERSPYELREQVTSPGGTTAAGLAMLESHAVRYAISEAVRAAAERSRELSQPH